MATDTISTTSQQLLTEYVSDTSSLSTVKEYWVTRVVRKMQGCPPSRIDSVIQANLPKREIRWSQCPDTLGIPGLEGRLPYDAGIRKLEYDPGFFKGNRWLSPELSVHQYRVSTEPLAQAQPYYDFLLTFVLICLVLLAVQINYARKFLQARAKGFFYTANERARGDNKDAMPFGTMSMTYLSLCITGGLYALYYVQSVRNLFLCIIPAHYLLAVYASCFAVMFLTKRLLASFINWIFFVREDHRLWHLDYNFLLIAETSVLMPLAALAICFGMPANTLLWVGLIIVAVAKILLLYKTFTIFLPHFYCFLHLLSYLCALEIMPCLALWLTLRGITDYLIITF